MKKWMIVLAALLLIGAVVWLYRGKMKLEEEEAPSMEAMYLEYGRWEKNHLFAQEDGNLLDITIPEDGLYNQKGEPMAREDLVPGDIVEVYGDGIIAESYPGQYPNVWKMVVVSKGSQKDMEKYLDYIYQYIYSEPDPAERPLLQLQYRNDMAAVSTMGILGENYDWTYLDYEEQTHHIENDSGDIRTWGPIYEFDLPKEVHEPGYQLYFTVKPDTLTLTAHGNDGEEAEVPVTEEEDGYYAPKLLKNTLYQVTATWKNHPYANGTVSYAFRTDTE